MAVAIAGWGAGGLGSTPCCPGCGALIPAGDGPTHAYMPAAPGCWAVYATLSDWQTRLQGEDGATTRQWWVDAYAAQHPNSADRRNRQSVALHLMSLCASLEGGTSGSALRRMLGGWAHRDYPELLPPPAEYAVIVTDVAAVAEERRPDLVRRMAETTWAAWNEHHATVRAWLSAAMGGRHGSRRTV